MANLSASGSRRPAASAQYTASTSRRVPASGTGHRDTNTAPAPAPFLDRSVHYDRLPAEVAARLEAISRAAAQQMLLEINRAALAMTDALPEPTTPTKRVNLGVYLFVEDEAPPAAQP